MNDEQLDREATTAWRVWSDELPRKRLKGLEPQSCTSPVILRVGQTVGCHRSSRPLSVGPALRRPAVIVVVPFTSAVATLIDDLVLGPRPARRATSPLAPAPSLGVSTAARAMVRNSDRAPL